MDLRAAWRVLWGLEQKQSKTGPLFALFGAGRPAPTPRRYDKLADEGFQKNAIVFRCVNLISECAAAVPWTLFRSRGGSREQLEAHPLLTLLDRPNPTQGGAAFFKAVYAFRLLSGNSYIEAVGPSDGPNAGRPKELWALRPDRMQVIKGDDGQPAGFQYQAGGGTVAWRVDPVTGRSPILHSKSFHPLDDWYGMSPLEAAAFEVDQHNAAGAWNYSLLKNSGRPSGALVYDPGEGTRGDVLDGEKFSEILQGLERDILRILTRTLITEPIAAGIRGGIQGDETSAGGLEGLLNKAFGTSGLFFGEDQAEEPTITRVDSEIADAATTSLLALGDAGDTAGSLLAGSLSEGALEAGVETLTQAGASTFATTQITDLGIAAGGAAAALQALVAAAGTGGGGGPGGGGGGGLGDLLNLGITAAGFAFGGPSGGAAAASLGPQFTGTGQEGLLASGSFASGGLVSGPGTGTSDSIPVFLSDGEFVVNTGATRRHRRLLEALNGNRLLGMEVFRAHLRSSPGTCGIATAGLPDIRPIRRGAASANSAADLPSIVNHNHFHGVSDFGSFQRNLPQFRGLMREMMSRAQKRDD